MNGLTILLLAGFIGAIMLMVIRLTRAIIDNFQTGQAVRLALAGRIGRMRYGRMLAGRRVNLNEFLHQRPLTEIEAGMRRCRACPATTECDRFLEQGVSSEQAPEFCPEKFR